MTQALTLLLLALCSGAQADLAGYLRGRSSISNGGRGVCEALGKSWWGYSMSTRSGASTYKMNCGGKQITVTCKSGACTSPSAGSRSGGSSGSKLQRAAKGSKSGKCYAYYTKSKYCYLRKSDGTVETSGSACASYNGYGTEWCCGGKPGGECKSLLQRAGKGRNSGKCYAYIGSSSKYCYLRKSDGTVETSGSACASYNGYGTEWCCGGKPGGECKSASKLQRAGKGRNSGKCYAYIGSSSKYCYLRKKDGTVETSGSACASYNGYGTDWCCGGKPDGTCKSSSGGGGSSGGSVGSWKCPSKWYTGSSAPSGTYKDALAYTMWHNVYRCMHGLPFLYWDNGVAYSTRKYFQYKRSMSHSPNSARKNQGENLHSGTVGYYTAKDATTGWYEEVNNCDSLPGCKRSTGGMIGHFTAMNWAGANKLGCFSNNYGLRACRYKARSTSSYCDTPNMNFAGKDCYRDNVWTKKASLSSCKAKVTSCFGKSLSSRLYSVDDELGEAFQGKGKAFAAAAAAFAAAAAVAALAMYAARRMRSRRGGMSYAVVELQEDLQEDRDEEIE